MTDRPIRFNAPMVRAILDGSKTQTRRILKPQIICHVGKIPSFSWGKFGGLYPDDWFGYGNEIDGALPYRPGDRLWVRETYYQRGHWWQDIDDLTITGRPKWKFAPYDHEIQFDAGAPANFLKSRSRADPAKITWYKRLGRFMPRRYSRLTLTVTGVRVERLQNISGADAVAEGMRSRAPDNGVAVAEFMDTWGRIYTRPGETWRDNPWVVAVSFDVRRGNIDAQEQTA